MFWCAIPVCINKHDSSESKYSELALDTNQTTPTAFTVEQILSPNRFSFASTPRNSHVLLSALKPRFLLAQPNLLLREIQIAMLRSVSKSPVITLCNDIPNGRSLQQYFGFVRGELFICPPPLKFISDEALLRDSRIKPVVDIVILDDMLFNNIELNTSSSAVGNIIPFLTSTMSNSNITSSSKSVLEIHNISNSTQSNLKSKYDQKFQSALECARYIYSEFKTPVILMCPLCIVLSEFLYLTSILQLCVCGRCYPSKQTY